jgi:hypothetical protein
MSIRSFEASPKKKSQLKATSTCTDAVPNKTQIVGFRDSVARGRGETAAPGRSRAETENGRRVRRAILDKDVCYDRIHPCAASTPSIISIPLRFCMRSIAA